MLSIRLWTSDNTPGDDALFWKSAKPAVCLALDLILASRGTPVATQGRILIVEFKEISSAIAAARRLQWALQGFAEAAGPGSAATAVLIHRSANQAKLAIDSRTLHALELASPGQILITRETGQLLKDLPGLPLEARHGSEVVELIWRGAEATATRSADEQAMAALFRQHGLEDPYPARPVTAQPDPVGKDRGQEMLEQTRLEQIRLEQIRLDKSRLEAKKEKTDPRQTAIVTSKELPTTSGQERLAALRKTSGEIATRWMAQAGAVSSRTWAIAGGAVLILGFALLLALIFWNRNTGKGTAVAINNPPHPTTTPQDSSRPPVSQTPKHEGEGRGTNLPTAQISTPETPVSPSGTEKQTLPDKKKHGEKESTSDLPSSNRGGSDCARVNGDSIQIADDKRRQHEYDDAISLYRRILDCQPNNEAAKRGLKISEDGKKLKSLEANP